MKEFKLFILSCFAIICVALFGSVFTSCSNDDDLLLAGDTQTELVSSLAQDSVKSMTRGLSSVTYNVSPSVGSYVSNSTINLPSSCGSGDFYGGVLSAYINGLSNSVLSVKVCKQNPLSYFTQNGKAYLKYAHPCGQVLTSGDYYAYNTFKTLYFNISNPGLTYGYYHIYPMVKNANSPYDRYYAEPILIFTTNLVNTSNYSTYGAVLGTANGVEVKCNGSYTNESDGEYQCVEFCKRYLEEVYGRDTEHYHNANLWYYDYTNFPSYEFARYSNSGSTPPRPGDILCMSGGSGNGHVAIIMDVVGYSVRIAQQNSGIPNSSNPSTQWQQPIGGELQYQPSTNTITPPSGYGIQGWMRYEP